MLLGTIISSFSFFLKKKEKGGKSLKLIVVHTNDGPMMEKVEGRAFIFML